jgi:predicted nucleotidyltransferase
MLDKQAIIDRLHTNREQFNAFGVNRIGLFGSYVRGRQHENSDIDLLVDFYSEAETFDNLMSLYDLLEDLFPNEKVEVVTCHGLSIHIGPKILEEVEYV